MRTILQDFLEKYPAAPLNKYYLPKCACPDDLGYIALCEENFDMTVQLCQECWAQNYQAFKKLSESRYPE